MLSRLCAAVWIASIGLLSCAGVHAQTPTATSATSTQAQALIDKVSPSIVTVRVVLKLQMKAGGQSESRESKLVTEGVVITPDGLIMMSDAPVASDVLWQLMGGDVDDAGGLSVTPTDFKVTIGNEEKEYTAFLAATDTKLGLAFLKIEDLAGRKLPAVDFSHPADVHVGDQLATITRLSKGYDYAPSFSQGQVKAAIDKPRSAFLLTTTIVSVGLPVFTIDGIPAGVMILLPADVEADSADGMDVMMRFYSGAAADRLGIFLVPASTVQPIIGEAITQATKLAADRAKNPPPTPTAAPAPTAPAKPTPPAAH